MKLSVKSDYAARAVLGLVRAYPSGESVRAEDLAAGQGLAVNYLVQILIELKSKQIVKSQRGKAGGYLLARAPSDVTLGDVIRAVHGEIFDSPALTDPSCPPVLRNAWGLLQTTLDATADTINFQQLADDSVAREKMYYI